MHHTTGQQLSFRHRAWRTRYVLGDVAQLGERLICIQEVAGSIPAVSTRLSCLPGLSPERSRRTQLGERLICIQEVSGSIPLRSTDCFA